MKDKQASGPLARRGSSPFPGAILLVNFKIESARETWLPVLQTLRFTDDEHRDEIRFRFGYCNTEGTLIARSLYLDETQLADLGRAGAREPEIRRMLRILCRQIGYLKLKVPYKSSFG